MQRCFAGIILIKSKNIVGVIVVVIIHLFDCIINLALIRTIQVQRIVLNVKIGTATWIKN